VVPNSPAAHALLEPGDLITDVAGDPVESMSDLAARIRGIEPGTRVVLTVERDGRTLEVPVTVGSG
jgi:S1-C subfamily serine protease